jgi:hypothetical protein
VLAVVELGVVLQLLGSSSQLVEDRLAVSDVVEQRVTLLLLGSNSQLV